METITIPIEAISLEGTLRIPKTIKAMVLFAHGSGSSRFSMRNNFVADLLYQAGIGTLLIDLLSFQEDQIYPNRFDIPLLTSRLIKAVEWIKEEKRIKNLPLGLFGASTGAASALETAALMTNEIKAVVSRGGRPDLAMTLLDRVKAPTLLIVGGLDKIVIDLNKDAYEKLQCTKVLKIIPGATHLFEEPGCLKEVAQLAIEWFNRYLTISQP